MRRLTNMQIEHLTGRITNGLTALRQREINALGPAPVLVTYTDEQKLALISSGKAKLRDDALSVRHYGVTNHFTYPETAVMRRAREKLQAYTQKVKAILIKYENEQTHLLDEAILGDSEAAMAMLQSVEARLAKGP